MKSGFWNASFNLIMWCDQAFLTNEPTNWVIWWHFLGKINQISKNMYVDFLKIIHWSHTIICFIDSQMEKKILKYFQN